MRAATALLGVLAAAPAPAAAGAIPYFARRYGVPCGECHVAPPKLNARGEAFVARGYDSPGRQAGATWPFAVWVSGRSEAVPGVAALRNYVNRVEIISGGRVVAPWLAYFVEWRPVSLETRADGSLRDRSGRFEDLFVVATQGRGEVTVGQFRLIGQVDVSRRLGVSEPLLLSASLPGTPGARSRETALRAFSPAGRSPAARVAYNAAAGGDWRWTTSAALPAPGELTLPLTDEARAEASNELLWETKGVLVESYARRGLHSVGAHLFYDHSGRYLAHALTTGARGPLHWTAIAGLARQGAATRGRWSLEAEYLPVARVGGGGRLEDLAGDGRDAAVLLYVNAHAPGTRYTVRLTVEQRIQRGRAATLVEVGTVF
ncbi:MAG: hypothetical protein ACREMC_08470 [Gemmatimonadales bacterium]